MEKLNYLNQKLFKTLSEDEIAALALTILQGVERGRSRNAEAQVLSINPADAGQILMWDGKKSLGAVLVVNEFLNGNIPSLQRDLDLNNTPPAEGEEPARRERPLS